MRDARLVVRLLVRVRVRVTLGFYCRAHLVVSQVEHAQLGLESHELEGIESAWDSKYSDVSKRSVSIDRQSWYRREGWSTEAERVEMAVSSTRDPLEIQLNEEESRGRRSRTFLQSH